MRVQPYKKILMTHDGSEMASAVLSHVVNMALNFNSEVVVLQVIESYMQISAAIIPAPPLMPGAESTIAVETIFKIGKQNALHNLARLERTLKTEGLVDVRVLMLEGNAKDMIMAFENEYRPDLIMMSTRGRSGLGRFLMGSVADYVVRNAKCPVFLMHPSV